MKNFLICFVVVVGLGSVPILAQNAPLISSHKPTVTNATVSKPAGAPVAKVDGTELTQRDLQREMEKIFPYASTHGGRIPGAFAPEIRRNALNQIIFDELMYQEAKRRKMAVPATTFNEIMGQAKKRFPSKAEYELYATQEYGSLKGFENQIRRALLIALLADREITQKSNVTELQVRQFYTANQKRFMKPESLWLQSISFNLPPNATPAQRAQARKRAEEVLPQAKAAKNFEEFGKLAEKYSEDDWRVMMGDHKWIHRGRMPSAVEDVAFSLQAGQTSGIIETSEAFVIVRANGKQPPTKVPYSQVSKALREDMQKATLEDRRKTFEQQLRRSHKVEEL